MKRVRDRGMDSSYSIYLSLMGCTSSTQGSMIFTGRSKGIVHTLASFDQLLKATCEGHESTARHRHCTYCQTRPGCPALDSQSPLKASRISTQFMCHAQQVKNRCVVPSGLFCLLWSKTKMHFCGSVQSTPFRFYESHLRRQD